jgi:hypothetical protein
LPLPSHPAFCHFSQITYSVNHEIGRSCCHWYWSSFRFRQKPRGQLATVNSRSIWNKMASTIFRTRTASFRNDCETTSTHESADSVGCYICFERCRIVSTFARLWSCDWFESQLSGIVGADGAADAVGHRGTGAQGHRI